MPIITLPLVEWIIYKTLQHPLSNIPFLNGRRLSCSNTNASSGVLVLCCTSLRAAVSTVQLQYRADFVTFSCTNKQDNTQPCNIKCLNSGTAVSVPTYCITFFCSPLVEKMLTQLSAGRNLGPGHVTFTNSSKKRPICRLTVTPFVVASPLNTYVKAKKLPTLPRIKTQKPPVKSSFVECCPLRPLSTSLCQDGPVSN